MEASEAVIIQRILDGDPDEYRALMDQCFHSVFRIAYRITGNEADAEEVAQEAFLRGFSSLSTFKQDSTFMTWMRRITINTSINFVACRNRDLARIGPRIAEDESPQEGTVQVFDRAAGPEQLLFASEAAALRATAMAALTPMERTAFTLRHMEDIPLAEIASALNVPINSVKQAVFRAVNKLRHSLSPLAGGMR